MIAATFQSLLQGFFTDRLLRQRQASPHTIAGYRDTFRLLFRFSADQLGKAPSTLSTEDFQPAFIGRFLEHLEQQRRNSSRTRNARLAAIHSFFRYVAVAEPAHALLCQQVLAMPSKRHQRRPIAFLDAAEITAILAAPDLSTWIGRRDRALLAVGFQTGLRVSELIGLRREHVVMGMGAHVRCDGKGRKQRCTPLGRDTAAVLDCWLKHDLPGEAFCVFPSIRGRPLSRDAVEELVARYAQRAQQTCPSLKEKRVSPHVLRHSSAMRLRAHGVDQSTLWLPLASHSRDPPHSLQATRGLGIIRNPSCCRLCRYRHNRHTVVTDLLEAGEPEHVIEAVTGHLSRRMLEHYSHQRLKAKGQILVRLEERRKRESASKAKGEMLARLEERRKKASPKHKSRGGSVS